MGDPTLTEVLTQFKNRCAIFEKIRLAGLSQTQNIVGLSQTDVDAVKGDFAADSLAALKKVRTAFSAPLDDADVAAALDPITKMAGVLIASPKSGGAELFGEFVKYCANTGRAAQGILTLDTNPTDADTMTIGAITYRFKNTMAAAEDIKIGATAADTQVSIVKTLNGIGLAGTDYYAGSTSPHTTVKAGESFSSNILTLTARTVGTAGNSLVSTETFTAGTNVFNASTLGTTTAGVNQITVSSRVMSFGSVTAGREDGSSNVGGGTVLRLTKDEFGNTIESGWGADTITLKCVSAEQQGSGAHQELFLIESKNAGVDRIAERGSGLRTENVAAFSSKGSENLLPNASFTSMAPATDGLDVTSLSNWVTSDGTLTSLKVSLGTVGTKYYRSAGPGDSIPKALQLTAVRTLYQIIRNNIDQSVPYLIQVAALPQSADGVCRINLRSYENTSSPGPILATSGWVTVTGSSWLFIRIPLDASCWPKTWKNGNKVALEFIWSGRTTGTLLLDDGVLRPFVKHDTLWYAPIGTATKFEVGDRFTFTDTETGAINVRWLGRAYKKNIPTTSGTPTLADATVT